MLASVNEPKKTSPNKIATSEKQKKDRIQVRASTVRIYSPNKKSASGKPVVARSINLREVIRRQISGPMGNAGSDYELMLFAPSESTNFDRLVIKVSSSTGEGSAEILVNIREYVLFSHDMKTKYGASADLYFQPESVDWWCSHIERILVLKSGKKGKILMGVSKASIEAILSESLPVPNRSSRGGNKQTFPNKIKRAVANTSKIVPQQENIGFEGKVLGQHDNQTNMKVSGVSDSEFFGQQTNFESTQCVQSSIEEKGDILAPHKEYYDAQLERMSYTAVKDTINDDLLKSTQQPYMDDSDKNGTHRIVDNIVISNAKPDERVYDDEFEAEEENPSVDTMRDKELNFAEITSIQRDSARSLYQSEDGNCPPEDNRIGVIEEHQQELRDSADLIYDDEFEEEQPIGADEDVFQPEIMPLMASKGQLSPPVQTTSNIQRSNGLIETHSSSVRDFVLDGEDGQSADDSYQDEFENEPSEQSSDEDSEVKEVLIEILEKIGDEQHGVNSPSQQR